MMDRNELREVLEEALKGHSIVDSERHEEHHLWIRERIESERARKEMMKSVTESVVQWSVLGILGGIWYWLQNGQWPNG